MDHKVRHLLINGADCKGSESRIFVKQEKVRKKCLASCQLGSSNRRSEHTLLHSSHCFLRPIFYNASGIPTWRSLNAEL